MRSTTVRISEEARETLRLLAEATGEPMNKVLERSVRDYHEHWLLEETNRAYERLRKDPERRAAYKAESQALAVALMDGLEREPDHRPAQRGKRRR